MAKISEAVAVGVGFVAYYYSDADAGGIAAAALNYQV